MASSPALDDHLGGTTADHDRRRVGRAGCNRRHHGSVGDAKIAHTMDAKLRVHDGIRIDAHPGGADGVPEASRRSTGEILQVLPRLRTRTRNDLRLTKTVQRFLVPELTGC